MKLPGFPQSSNSQEIYKIRKLSQVRKWFWINRLFVFVFFLKKKSFSYYFKYVHKNPQTCLTLYKICSLNINLKSNAAVREMSLVSPQYTQTNIVSSSRPWPLLLERKHAVTRSVKQEMLRNGCVAGQPRLSHWDLRP